MVCCFFFVVFMVLQSSHQFLHAQHVMAPDPSAQEPSSSEDLCRMLENVHTTEVFLTTTMEFSGSCPLNLINRGVVRITCLGSGMTHFHCPRYSGCFEFTSLSLNSSFATVGCNIVGGGYIRATHSLINLTIDKCVFTTET
eukprot:PhF_6_TR19029/c0_g1_i1/m.27936